MNTYEGMFLLDNEVVRADWQKAKSVVTDVLAKHGAEVVSARRWDERKLAYPIKHRRRGTYLLAYYNMGVDGIDGLRRDLELSEAVTRYLLLRAEEVPADEIEKSQAENAADFTPPPVPEDDEPPEPEPPAPAPKAEAPKTEEPKAEEAASEEGAEKKSDEAPAEEAPAETASDEATEKKEEA